MREKPLHIPLIRALDLRRPVPEVKPEPDERVECIRLKKDDTLQYTIYRRMG
jgi:hypothetical protein